MTVDPGERSRRLFPLGPRWAWRRRPVVELTLLVVGVAVFSRLHRLAGTDVSQASANARVLQSLEHTLGLDVELAANHWLSGSPGLMMAAVWYYRLYYLPLVGVLLWVLFRHADVYRTVRVVLVVMAALALLSFWVLPMSPPRFALPGIVDIVAEHDVVGGASSRDLSNGQNHFSAFPSLHVGWSALCAYAAWLALRSRHPWMAGLVWLHPVVMVGVVISTGNHYLLDVAGSAALLAVSIAVSVACSRHGRDRTSPASAS